MSDVPVTGMTERALFCMYPEDLGGCDVHDYLVPVHHKIEDPEKGETISDTIVGWLCKPHALELAFKKRESVSREVPEEERL